MDADASEAAVDVPADREDARDTTETPDVADVPGDGGGVDVPPDVVVCNDRRARGTSVRDFEFETLGSALGESHSVEKTCLTEAHGVRTERRLGEADVRQRKLHPDARRSRRSMCLKRRPA
jgi:hypothetical protein